VCKGTRNGHSHDQPTRDSIYLDIRREQAYRGQDRSANAKRSGLHSNSQGFFVLALNQCRGEREHYEYPNEYPNGMADSESYGDMPPMRRQNGRDRYYSGSVW
jgi:hypothetical protein